MPFSNRSTLFLTSPNIASINKANYFYRFIRSPFPHFPLPSHPSIRVSDCAVAGVHWTNGGQEQPFRVFQEKRPYSLILSRFTCGETCLRPPYTIFCRHRILTNITSLWSFVSAKLIKAWRCRISFLSINFLFFLFSMSSFYFPIIFHSKTYFLWHFYLLKFIYFLNFYSGF